jgi:hypothetical protein
MAGDAEYPFKGQGDKDLFLVEDSSLVVPDGFRATAWDASRVLSGSGNSTKGERYQ